MEVSMIKKKTIRVEALRSYANDILQMDGLSKDMRNGIILMIERVLHDCGNYNGFNYLSSASLSKDIIPGIRWNDINGKQIADFENTDRTRRYYK